MPRWSGDRVFMAAVWLLAAATLIYVGYLELDGRGSTQGRFIFASLLFLVVVRLDGSNSAPPTNPPGPTAGGTPPDP